VEKLRLIVAKKLWLLSIIGFLGSLGGLSGKSNLNPKQITVSPNATVEEKTSAYFELIEFYLEEKRDYHQTKIHLAKVKPLVQKLNTNKAWGEYFKLDGTLAKRKHDNKHAVKSFLSASEYLHKSRDYESQAKAYYKIGQIFSHQSNYQKAIYYYQLGLDILHKYTVQSYILETKLYSHMGQCLLEIKKHTESLAALYKGKSLAEKEHLVPELCDILYAIGKNYAAQKKYRSAFSVFSKVQKVANTHHLNFLEMNVLKDFCDVSLELGYMEKAKECGFKKKEIALLLRDSNCVNIGNYLIANVFLAEKNTDSALIYNNFAMNGALHKGRDSTERDIWILQSALMEQQGNTFAALVALENAEDLKDKIASSEQKLNIERQRQEMTILKEEQETKQRINNRLKEERLIWQFLAGFVTLSILISLFFLFKILINHKANRLLTLQSVQIEEQKDQLERLSQVKNQLFAVISHDLRSPLWAIQAVLDTLNETDLPIQDRSHWINLLHQQTAKTSVLLENLLLWAKIQMNSYKPLKEHFKLRPIIDELEDAIKVIFAGKRVAINNKVCVNFTLNSDPVMIRMALRNLLTNAIKFSDEGQEVEIYAEQISEGLAIHIKDHGIGITDEQLRKALDGQLSRFGTKGEVGSGMGLSLVRQFLEKQGGKLLGKATREQGCTFTIILPF
jgi:signal transduction histidine kinase